MPPHPSVCPHTHPLQRTCKPRPGRGFRAAQPPPPANRESPPNPGNALGTRVARRRMRRGPSRAADAGRKVPSRFRGARTRTSAAAGPLPAALRDHVGCELRGKPALQRAEGRDGKRPVSGLYPELLQGQTLLDPTDRRSAARLCEPLSGFSLWLKSDRVSWKCPQRASGLLTPSAA